MYFIKTSGVQDTGVHAQYCAKDEHVHNLITIQKYQEKEIRGHNIQVKNTLKCDNYPPPSNYTQ